jgi:hypothetical protein
MILFFSAINKETLNQWKTKLVEIKIPNKNPKTLLRKNK